MFVEKPRRLWVALVTVMWCLVTAPAFAREIPTHPKIDPHEVDGSALGGPVDLTQNWLVQQGDDARYADPKFDDSSWMVVDAGKTLQTYGLRDVDVVWYRTHVYLPPAEQGMQLLVRAFAGSFEVFVNGVRVGSSGLHPLHGSVQTNTDLHFDIPDALIASGQVVVALRATIGRVSAGGTDAGGLINWTTVLLGPAPEIANETSLSFFRNYTSNVTNLMLELLVPLIALALAITLPKEREYVALVISGMAFVLNDALTLWRNFHHSPASDAYFFVSGVLTAVAVIYLLEFVRRTLGLPMRRWYAAYLGMVLLMLVVGRTVFSHMYALGSGGTNMFLLVVNVLGAIVLLPFDVGIPLVLLWAWKSRRSPDALLLFVPFLLRSIVQYWSVILGTLYRLHLRGSSALPTVPIQGIFIAWDEVANLAFSMALLVFLMVRTVRIARSRAAMANDLHAVQSVQEILLARASHDTPGFHIEHVYYPASEVGGDFFLVSPAPDGSVTAIVGDVSGKGLVAAMRVSMILGVLRREEQRQPGAILRGLNEALMMQGEMGFTTACCVRVERDGRYTVANAGHISPYIGGEELDTPHSLPLGLVGDQEFEQVEGVLQAGKTMVLMSDGVVEARAASGELYGFERLGALTMMSADDIADVARRFGQDDDITVLTLTMSAQWVEREALPAMVPLPA